MDPSIALSLGKVKPAASNNVPIDTRVAVQTQPELDLLAEVSAESSQPHQPANLMVSLAHTLSCALGLGAHLPKYPFIVCLLLFSAIFCLY